MQICILDKEIIRWRRRDSSVLRVKIFERKNVPIVVGENTNSSYNSLTITSIKNMLFESSAIWVRVSQTCFKDHQMKKDFKRARKKIEVVFDYFPLKKTRPAIF